MSDSEEDAEHRFERELAATPDDFWLNLNYGHWKIQRGDYPAACDLSRRAVELDPASALAKNNLGYALLQLGELVEAEAMLRAAAAQQPDLLYAGHNLLDLHLRRGDAAAVVETARALLPLDPNPGPIRQELALALYQLGRYREAIAVLVETLARFPAEARSHNLLGLVHAALGDVEAARALFAAALALDADYDVAHSNLLLMLNYRPADPREVFERHIEWAKRHALPSEIAPPAPRRRPKVRIGWVSPNFNSHSVAQFVLPILRHRNRDRFEAFLYATTHEVDWVTELLRGLSDRFCSVAHLAPPAFADLLRSDEIDILVDLAGHMGDNRLRVFGAQPAPLQVTYLGYPNTTGLAAIDCRLTDAIVDPPGPADAFYSERLVRLDRHFLCYEPVLDCPPALPPPAVRTGRVTFGSFNHLAKITGEVVAVWAAVLAAVPRSRLLLKGGAFSDAVIRARWEARFADHGIGRERLLLRGRDRAQLHHLASYSDVDIALDSFPYNGTATSFEALWMGVPLIALTGDCHAARVGTSILTTLGRPDLIAADARQYVEIARRLAGDLDALARRRRALRAEMNAHGLTDGPAFAAALEEVFLKLVETETAPRKSAR